MSRSGAKGRKMTANGNGGNGNGNAKIPLLPSGVNNKATMPYGENKLKFKGEELIDIVQVTSSQEGEVIFNRLVTPKVVARLSTVSDVYQRIKWNKAEINIVPLNGSTTTSGYTAGYVEDPEIPIPTGKAVIRFLTAMRSTVVRQAWVADCAGKLVAPSNLPEMYTQVGSDIRRWAIGRVVIAAGGNIVNGSFQVMLKYDVEMFVPISVNPDFPLSDFFTAPQLTNNAERQAGGLRLPQTNGTYVPYNADVVISGDLFLTAEQSAFVGVTEPAIVRAGTRVKFVPVLISNINYIAVVWDGRPEGESFYLTNVVNVTGTQYLTMNAIGWTTAGNQSFRTWVARSV